MAQKKLLPASDPESPLHPQFKKLMDALTTVETMVTTFAHSTEDLAIVADRIEGIVDTFRGYSVKPLKKKEPKP